MDWNILLKNYLIEENISTHEFSKDLNISKDEANNILDGTMEPNLQLLKKISDTTGVNIDYLIGHGKFKYRHDISEDEFNFIDGLRNTNQYKKSGITGIELIIYKYI